MTGVFETQTFQVCPTEPIICVKEKKQSLLFFPKFFATQKTFLNANIISNLKKCPPQCFAEVSGSYGE